MRLFFAFLFVAFLLSGVSAQGKQGNNTLVTNGPDTTTTPSRLVDPKVTPTRVVSLIPTSGNDSTSTTEKATPHIPVDPKVTPTRVVSSIPTSGNDSTNTTEKATPHIPVDPKVTPTRVVSSIPTSGNDSTSTTEKATPRLATTAETIDATTNDYDDYSSTSNNTTTDGPEPLLEKMATSTKIILGICILLVIMIVICLGVGHFGWKYYKKGGSIPFIRKRKEEIKTKSYEKLKLFDDQTRNQSDRNAN